MNLHRRLEWALDEDLGPGDVTTEATIPADRMGSAVIVAKSPGVVSGLAAVKATFDIVSRRSGGFVSVRPMVSDGQWVNAGDEVVRLSGSLPSVLMGERVALNLLMRMTGIATHVASILREVGPTTFVAVDTRKTTPLWRDLEKAAVRHGGGGNHRFGLFDGILIKENHILAAGGLSQAVEAAKKSAHHLLKVEVEVETLDELAEALEAGADVVMLDNMSDAQLRQAIAQVDASGASVLIEASGNMDAKRMKAIAAFGLDRVSVGGFIHQARWSDMSLRILHAGVHEPVAD